VTNPQTIRNAPKSTAQHGAAATIAIAIVAGTAVACLLLAAITFAALAIAFPIAVPVALQFHIPVAPTDVETAKQFAALWWVFGAFSVASLAAAAAITIKTLVHVGPAPAA